MSDRSVERTSPVGNEGATEEGQVPAFVEERLGIHSSHPSTAARRLWFWRLAAVAVGGAALSYAALAVYRAFAWEKTPLGGALSGLRQAIKSTDTILFALAMALSAVLAAALTIRISRIGSEFAHRPSGRLAVGGSIVALVVATFAFCALFGWLATTGSIPAVARNRWWVAVAAALPLEALLVFVEFRERRRESSTVGWLLAAVRQAFFAASVAATAMVMTPSVSRSIGSTVGGWLKAAGGMFGGLLDLIPGADLLIGIGARIVDKGLGGFLASTLGLAMAMATVAWVTTKVSSIAGAERKEPSVETAPAPPGWFARLVELLNPIRWFRSQPEAVGKGDGASTATDGPDWLGSVAKVVGPVAHGPVRVEFRAAVDPATIVESKDYAPVSSESQLDCLFDGRAPTCDQADALRMFDDLWLRHSRTLQSAAFGPAPHSHCDMLIQAFPEAFADPEDQGVLELQVAAALVAVVARGQRALFLVPGDEDRGVVLDAVRRRLAALRMDTLYRVGSLGANDLALWAPPAAAPGTVMQERPPDIMVATLEDYEQGFFGGASAGHVMRALLFDAEVVMVPNLMALTRAREGRVHFPFIVDKHRLVLASENRTLQLVVGSPPIGERPVPGRGGAADADTEPSDPEIHVALEAVALRLFGGDARLAGHSAVLRRRVKSFPARAVVRVPAATIRECVDAVTTHVARSLGTDRVCLVLGREEPRPSPARMKALSVGDAQVAVLHELDVADGSELAERLAGFDCVVTEGRAGGRVVRELAARLDPALATLVEVTSGAPVILARVPQWSIALPVFPSAESPALALSHLRSAVFHVSDDCLIRRDELVRFGVSWNRARWRAGGAFKTMHEGWAIELDGCADAGIGATSDQGIVWPAAVLRSDVRKERPVALSAPIERGLGLAGDEVLVLAEDGQAPDRARSACWVGPRGQILGQVDLAYASRFVWSADRQEYRAIAAERSAEHGWIIQGHPFHGDGDEPELPAVTIAVDLPCDAIGTALQVRQGENVRVFSVRDRGGDARCMSRERIIGLVARGHRGAGGGRGVAAESVAPIGPIEFSVRIGVSFVCLGSSDWIAQLPPPSAAHDEMEPLPAWIHGRWDVGAAAAGAREFSPAFTAAVQRSLHAVAPGVLDFSRVAAFRIHESHEGVVIAFIEPHATVGTAAEAMRVVLDDPSLRKRFVGKLIEGIASDIDEDGPPAPVIVTALDADGLAADLQWAKRLITAIPGGVIDVGAPIGILARDSAAALDERPAFQPTPVTAEGLVHSWNWPSQGEDVTLAVEIGISQAQADEATVSFGWTPPEADPERLRRCGIRTYEGNRIGPDYAWMVRRSEAVVKPLAERLLAVAELAGAASPRQQVEVFASFVQSLRYRRSAEGRLSDGKQRMGVQMPAETLYTRAGDCDSLSVLLVALVREAGIAKGCVILIDEVDGGHAMAAFEVEPRSKKDWSVTVRLEGASGNQSTFTVVETTAPGWRLGTASPEYHGRYVRLDAIG